MLDRLVSLEAVMHDMQNRIVALEDKTGITAERRKAEEKRQKALREAQELRSQPATATAASWPFAAGKKDG